MLTFALGPNDSPAARVARIAQDVLTPGPMGAFVRGADYAAFLDIWDLADDSTHLLDFAHSGEVLDKVHTSCAVFASACLGYAGFRLAKPWKADGTWSIMGATRAWLQPLSEQHPAWVPADGSAEPGVGAIILRAKSHVELVTERLPNGLWRCAAGGGSPEQHECQGLTPTQIKVTNGTLCRMTPPAGKDVFAPDGLGRRPSGWIDTNLIGLPSYEEILEQLREANS